MTARQRTPADEDQAYQVGVMALPLDEFPHFLTADEVQRQLAGPDATWSAADGLERAINELARGGLVHQQGRLVLPSRAARLFQALDLD